MKESGNEAPKVTPAEQAFELQQMQEAVASENEAEANMDKGEVETEPVETEVEPEVEIPEAEPLSPEEQEAEQARLLELQNEDAEAIANVREELKQENGGEVPPENTQERDQESESSGDSSFSSESGGKVELKPCPKCGGTGRRLWILPCWTCGASGRVEVGRTESWNTKVTKSK